MDPVNQDIVSPTQSLLPWHSNLYPGLSPLGNYSLNQAAAFYATALATANLFALHPGYQATKASLAETMVNSSLYNFYPGLPSLLRLEPTVGMAQDFGAPTLSLPALAMPPSEENSRVEIREINPYSGEDSSKARDLNS